MLNMWRQILADFPKSREIPKIPGFLEFLDFPGSGGSGQTWPDLAPLTGSPGNPQPGGGRDWKKGARGTPFFHLFGSLSAKTGQNMWKIGPRRYLAGGRITKNRVFAPKPDPKKTCFGNRGHFIVPPGKPGQLPDKHPRTPTAPFLHYPGLTAVYRVRPWPYPVGTA